MVKVIVYAGQVVGVTLVGAWVLCDMKLLAHAQILAQSSCLLC